MGCQMAREESSNLTKEEIIVLMNQSVSGIMPAAIEVVMAAKKSAKKVSAKKTAKKAVKKAAKKISKKAASKKVVKKAPAGKKSSAKKKSKSKAKPRSFTHEEISVAAYVVYLKRCESGAAGDQASDWAEAERLLAAGKI